MTVTLATTLVLAAGSALVFGSIGPNVLSCFRIAAIRWAVKTAMHARTCSLLGATVCCPSSAMLMTLGRLSWLPSSHRRLRCREMLPGHSRLAMALALTVRLAYLLSLLAAFPLQASETLACRYCDQRFQLPWLVCSSLHAHG